MGAPIQSSAKPDKINVYAGIRNPLTGSWHPASVTCKRLITAPDD